MPEQKQGDEKVEHSVWLQQATADSVTALLPLLRCNGTSPVSARAVRSYTSGYTGLVIPSLHTGRCGTAGSRDLQVLRGKPGPGPGTWVVSRCCCCCSYCGLWRMSVGHCINVCCYYQVVLVTGVERLKNLQK